LTLSDTGEQSVMLRTVSFVVCLVYGIRRILRRCSSQINKAGPAAETAPDRA